MHLFTFLWNKTKNNKPCKSSFIMDLIQSPLNSVSLRLWHRHLMPDIKYEGVLIATQDEHLPAITIENITTKGSTLSSPPPSPNHILVMYLWMLLHRVTTVSTQISTSYYRMLLHTIFEKPSDSITLVHVHTVHIRKLSFLTKWLKHLLNSKPLSLHMYKACDFFFRDLKEWGASIKLNFSRIFHFGKCSCLRK